ncbi:MAG: PEP-CTERM sorting domain-containing protein [Phycisphaerales bacterium]|nr:PEP-CTERM sorting domain-containing protein [Phycisphaerales bacterium]MCB9856569.1 PEP-CTERM sorting domain-containing protein [Phycisphaerales bacterium]MCB9864634.1 PEP-CTERM sorting domain-containing protein [Phycisphaerales bacterium]
MTTTNRIRTFTFSLMAGLAVAANASAGVLDFDGFAHGQIMTNQLQASDGVTISADNPNRAFDIAAIFNTNFAGMTPDPDLVAPWDAGNLAPNTNLGNALILSQTSTLSAPGILAVPNDEGSRPAGKLILDFDSIITSVGFDLIDVESITSEDGMVMFYLNGVLLDSIAFDEFVTPGQFYDPTVVYGNNSANRISPISIGDLDPASRGAALGFDRVVFALGGSGAIDTIQYVPEPATLSLVVLGGITMIRRRRTA